MTTKSLEAELVEMAAFTAKDLRKYKADTLFVPIEAVLTFLRKHSKQFDENALDFYHKIGKPEVWNMGKDQICDVCEERAIRLKNEEFGGNGK